MLITNLQPTIIPTIDIQIKIRTHLKKTALGFCLGNLWEVFVDCEINQKGKKLEARDP